MLWTLLEITDCLLPASSPPDFSVTDVSVSTVTSASRVACHRFHRNGIGGPNSGQTQTGSAGRPHSTLSCQASFQHDQAWDLHRPHRHAGPVSSLKQGSHKDPARNRREDASKGHDRMWRQELGKAGPPSPERPPVLAWTC